MAGGLCCSCCSLRTQGILVGIFAVVLFHLGFFDWPKFTKQSSIILEGNAAASNQGPLYALMVTSTQRDIGNHVGRLVGGVYELLSQAPLIEMQEQHHVEVVGDDGTPQMTTTTNLITVNTTSAMSRAARLYGTPQTCNNVGIGLYFDNPTVVEDPKWAVGWLVHVANFDILTEVANQLNSQKSMILGEQNVQYLPEEIKPVRVGGSGTAPVYKARIPWRSMFTPMIAPILHWSRAPPEESTLGVDPKSIACEIYVDNPTEYGTSYIDYIVLPGTNDNTKYEWYDLFP